MTKTELILIQNVLHLLNETRSPHVGGVVALAEHPALGFAYNEALQIIAKAILESDPV